MWKALGAASRNLTTLGKDVEVGSDRNLTLTRTRKQAQDLDYSDKYLNTSGFCLLPCLFLDLELTIVFVCT